MLAGANAVRYRVEGPFESVTQAARRSDVVEVAYDPQWSVEGTVYDSLLHAPLPGADVWVRLRRPVQCQQVATGCGVVLVWTKYLK